MTQLAALNILIRGDSKDLQADLAAAKKQLEEFGRQAGGATAPVGTFGGALTRLGNISNQTKSRIQNAGFQIQDAAIQMQMGTRASVILAQQGSQLASAFGPIGMVFGTLAAVTIPLMAAAFGSMTTEVKTVKDAMQDLSDKLDALNTVAENYSGKGVQALVKKYGELNAQVLQFLELQRKVAIAEAVTAAADAMAALSNELDGIVTTNVDNLAKAFDTTTDDARSMLDMMKQVNEASSFSQQLEIVTRLRTRLEELTGGFDNMDASQRQVYLTVVKTEDALRQLANAAPEASWMNAAISGLTDLGTAIQNRIKDALELRRAMPGGGQYTVGTYDGGPDSARTRTQFGGAIKMSPTGAGLPAEKTAGGGAGGGGNDLQNELKTFTESLMTKEQLQMESYARQQEMLVQAKAAQLITQQEYDQYMADAAMAHANEMAQIKQQEADMIRQASTAMYGELEGLLGMFAGKSKAAAIAAIALNKGLRIAEIIQNTAAAQMRAMAELGPIAGPAAAAKIGLMGKIQAGIVAATGLAQAAGSGGGGGGGQVASSVGRGGGGDGGGGSTAGTYLNFQFVGGLAKPEEIGRYMVKVINDAIENGAVIKGARVT